MRFIVSMMFWITVFAINPLIALALMLFLWLVQLEVKRQAQQAREEDDEYW